MAEKSTQVSKFNNWIERNITLLIFCFSFVASILSFYLFLQLDLITAYGDSRAHLNIARRSVDGLEIGFGQMVGSWLPLLHLLMLPTIWIDQLWFSGISGSLVNMIAYIVCCIFIYKLVFSLTGRVLNGICAFLIISVNTNVLYFQATPMTEVLFMATLIVALYFVSLWLKSRRVVYLVLSSIFMALTSLNRYEGWFVIICSIFVIGLYSFLKLGWKKTESNMILYSIPACFGIVLWLIFQQAINGSPFAFLNNEFAAGVQTAKDIQNGLVPTYKNLFLSVMTQIYTMNHISGVLLTILFFLSLIFYLIKTKFDLTNKLFIVFIIAFAPFIFEIIVLFLGKVPTYVPEIRIDKEIPNFFNIRYALYSLPAFAILVAASFRNKVVVTLIITLVLINNFYISPLYMKRLAAIDDASVIKSHEIYYEKLLPKDYDGKKILISAASSESIIAHNRMSLKNYITESASKYWKVSMVTPQKYASWIILNNQSNKDSLMRELNKSELDKYYFVHTEIRDSSGWMYRLYKKKDTAYVNKETCIVNYKYKKLDCKIITRKV